MMGGLEPYPSLVDSGVPWLGSIPTGWEIKRLKWVARLNPSKSESRGVLAANSPVTFLPMERVGVSGGVDSSQTRPASALWNGLTYFRRGDVIVAKITPCFENGKGACLHSLPTDIGFGSTEFFVLRARDEITPQFLYRVTTLPEFRILGADAMTGAAGQKRVPGRETRTQVKFSENEELGCIPERADSADCLQALCRLFRELGFLLRIPGNAEQERAKQVSETGQAIFECKE